MVYEPASFFFALASGILVAAASGLIGSFLILRKMSLMSDALSHVALPGIALGVILKFSPLWGGLAALFLGIVLIWFIETKTKLATESVTGVLFVTALAAGALLIPQQELLEAFFGSGEGSSFLQMALQAGLAAIVIIAILRYQKSLTLFSIAPDLATSVKIAPAKMEFILLALIALTIAIGISFVGVLLISALSIIPAAAARNFAHGFNAFIRIAVLLAIIALTSGLVLNHFFGVNAGIATVLVAAGFFAVSLLKRK